ncbi:ABC transporter substrate-binding protein [Lederbergia panacisoli]|uniref:ABC transporter substrate-binding protein n=1 Tax=Lederbergia panacisoli TaxID=1255251 RepID=UPI00214B08DD|nr:sugar ABC transporter substrate-binding protein [Lederbergia panacisoli]MCR2823042.1 sugar ABC transporter substrate-binding protein [Lederbergia panacisoli]
MKKGSILIIPTLISISIIGAVFIFINQFFGQQTEKKDTTDSVEKKIELTFWRNSGNQSENKAYEELVSKFQMSNPSIKINMESIPYGDYEVRLRTEFAAGSPPDIMTIDSPNLGLYANAGSLLSINDYMKEEGGIFDFPKSTISGMSFNNEIYLAPIVESSIALFYNKKIFKEAGIPLPSKDPNNPMTWDEVLEIAKQLHNPDEGIYAIDPAQGFGDGEGPAYFKIPLLWQFGGDVLSPDGLTAKGYLDSLESLKALQFYQELYNKYNIAEVELPPESFETGQLAMTVLGSWVLEDLKKNYPDFILGEDFDVAPLPKGVKQLAPNGGWALGISAKTKYPEEAWKFVKYITSYEGVKTYVSFTGDLPARQSVAKEFPELNEYPKNIFLQQSQKFSKNRPVSPVYPVISETIKVLFEDVGIGNKDVKKSAEEAVKKIDSSISKISKP